MSGVATNLKPVKLHCWVNRPVVVNRFIGKDYRRARNVNVGWTIAGSLDDFNIRWLGFVSFWKLQPLSIAVYVYSFLRIRRAER